MEILIKSAVVLGIGMAAAFMEMEIEYELGDNPMALAIMLGVAVGAIWAISRVWLWNI